MRKKFSLEVGKYLIVKIDAMFDLWLVKITDTSPLVVMASASDRHRLNHISAKRFKIEERLSAVLQDDFENKTETVFAMIKKNISLVTELPEFRPKNHLILIEVTKLH